MGAITTRKRMNGRYYYEKKNAWAVDSDAEPAGGHVHVKVKGAYL